MRKRLLAGILAVSLCMGLFAVPVAADETEGIIAIEETVEMTEETSEETDEIKETGTIEDASDAEETEITEEDTVKEETVEEEAVKEETVEEDTIEEEIVEEDTVNLGIAGKISNAASSTVTVDITTAGIDKTYTITPDETALYTFRGLDKEGKCTRAILCAGDGEEMADKSFNTGSDNFILKAMLDEGETYFIHFSYYYEDKTGSYDVSVTKDTPKYIITDCGNTKIETDYYAEEDSYYTYAVFIPQKSGNYNFTSTGASDPRLVVYDQTFNMIASNDNISEDDLNFSVSNLYLKAYRVYILYMNGYSHDYPTFTLKINPYGQEEGTITKQPVYQTGKVGDTVHFTIETSSSLPLQWQVSKDGGQSWVNSTGTGNKTNDLAIKITKSNYKYLYRCRVTVSKTEKIYSDEVGYKLIPWATITKQPSSIVAKVGDIAHFSCIANNDEAYQWIYSNDGSSWYKSTADGANSPFFNIKVSNTTKNRLYKCAVTGTDGSVTYSQKVAIITASKLPQDATAAIGQKATFSVVADNAASYQWQYTRNGSNWFTSGSTGATTDTLIIKVSSVNQNNSYRCKITDNRGYTGYTSPVGIKEPVTPEITTQPKDFHGATGQDAYFYIEAENVASYQWQYSKNGYKWYNSSSDSAKTSTIKLVISDSNRSNLYRCKLTSADGTTVYSDTVVFEEHDLYYGYVPTQSNGDESVIFTSTHYVYCAICNMRGEEEAHTWDGVAECSVCTVCNALLYPDMNNPITELIPVPAESADAVNFSKLRCAHPNAEHKPSAGGSVTICPDCGYAATTLYGPGPHTSCDHELFYNYDKNYYSERFSYVHWIECSKCGMTGRSEEHEWDHPAEGARCTKCRVPLYLDMYDYILPNETVEKGSEEAEAFQNLIDGCPHASSTVKFTEDGNYFYCFDCGLGYKF